MLKAMKWLVIIFGLMAVLILMAVIIAPMVINLEKYKPRIEAEASKAVGRPVTLGGRISPSVFPWVGVALSDVHVGNPPGFEEVDFVSIGAFEVRIKVLPMLSGRYEIKRFVLKDPWIALEKARDGRSNLEGIGMSKEPSTPVAEPESGTVSDPTRKSSPLPIRSLDMGEFTITNGRLRYIDHASGNRHEIREIDLNLQDVSLDKAIQLDFSAVADGHPVKITGSLGPVGPEPGKTPVMLDLSVMVTRQLQILLTGRIDDPMDVPKMDLKMQVAPFSPRDLLAGLNQALPFDPADSKTLTRLALTVTLTGTADAFRITDGKLTLDDSQMQFHARAEALHKPDLTLEAQVDRIDLDRYLPAAPPAGEPGATPTRKPADSAAAQIDYRPLRTLLLNAQLSIGDAKVKNIRMRNMVLKVTADNGVIRMDPLDLDLYSGRVSAATTVDVRQQQPRTVAALAVTAVPAGPLIKDLLDKELIDGLLTAAASLRFRGDTADDIRGTLSGTGELNFIDGAVIGIDLADMVRNVQAAFGLAEKPTGKPRTDFSELIVPFVIETGVFRMENARLNSPLLRVTAGGSADLVQETLNMRVEPKFVATLKGQGDTDPRSGIMVPVNVRGSFSDPVFRPDLAAIVQQPLPDRETLRQMIPPKETIQEGAEQRARELLRQRGQELLKGLPPGPSPQPPAEQ